MHAISQKHRLLVLVSCVTVAMVWPEGTQPADGPTTLTAAATLQDPKPPETLDPKKGCMTSKCHQKLGKGAFVHGPVAVQKCAMCHQQSDPKKHEFVAQPRDASCKSCHELRLKKVVHGPLADGQCTVCHDPHQSSNKFLLRTTNEKALCGQCHEQTQMLDKKFVHGPLSAGKCSLCHDAHSSYYPGLLNKRSPENCLKCHTDMEQMLQGAKHWHRPVSDNCSLCHDAHASDHPFQLKDEPRAMCLDCHQDKKKEIEGANVFHEALTKENGCRNCHKTHASRFPKLLIKPVRELCTGCHDKPQHRSDGSIVSPVAKRISESKYLHGPIREGDCSSCHNPHGSKNFSLLRNDYPKRFYAPFDIKSYNLCFKCHDPKVFTTEKTATLTDFRDGDRNLHFVHVNKETKGRTCRACHRTHASNLPMHMADKVPFGGWEIPIEFKSTATGGSCSPGCHKPKTYNFTKPAGTTRPKGDDGRDRRKDR